MKTTAKNKLGGCLAGCLLIVSSVVMAAVPSQGAGLKTDRPAEENNASPKADAARMTKSPMLAHTTTAPKPEKVAAASSKPAPDKKMLNRCWQRLMNNLREVRNAHRRQSR